MTSFIYARKNLSLTALAIILGAGFTPALALGACAQTPAPGAQVQQAPQAEEQSQKQVEEQAEDQVQPAEEVTEDTMEEATEEAPKEAIENASQAKDDSEANPKDMTAPAKTPSAPESAPIGEKAKSEWSANGCYTQADGKVECLCDSEETCKTLQESDVCEPGTEWMTEDKVGGCTQKAK